MQTNECICVRMDRYFLTWYCPAHGRIDKRGTEPLARLMAMSVAMSENERRRVLELIRKYATS